MMKPIVYSWSEKAQPVGTISVATPRLGGTRGGDSFQPSNGFPSILCKERPLSTMREHHDRKSQTEVCSTKQAETFLRNHARVVRRPVVVGVRPVLM